MGVLNLLSPGVLVREIDLSGIIPAVSSSVGAYVGQFSWGPCDIPPHPSPTDTFCHKRHTEGELPESDKF
jgi:hypothetical protein